jgi:hypothetical protein
VPAWRPTEGELVVCLVRQAQETLGSLTVTVADTPCGKVAAVVSFWDFGSASRIQRGVKFIIDEKRARNSPEVATGRIPSRTTTVL